MSAAGSRPPMARSTIVSALTAMVVLAGVAAVIVPGPARGVVTGLSTTYKTGTDLTTLSTAASPGAPGGPVTGVTHPGDTIKWVVGYQNNATTNASVNITDPLTGAGAYVPGSLQLPPNPDGTQPFSAQFSTDQGATWQPGTPPAGASGVGLTGTFPPGTEQQSVNPSPPVSVSLTNSAGDGYNALSSADDTLVYAVFHHNSTNQNVFCATTTGDLCPGWPAGSNVSATYVSPVAGTPVGTGANGMITAWQNGTYIAGGNLYWEAEYTTPVNGVYPVGVMCLNLTTLDSCGFTQLDTLPYAPSALSGGQIGGTGIPASNGNYYFQDADGNLLCFSPSASGGSSCGTTSLVTAGSGFDVMSATYGNYVIGQVLPPGPNGIFDLTCYDVATGTACPGYPLATGPNFGNLPPGQIAPILNSSGTLTGACVIRNSLATGCWDLSGNPVADPYPAGTGPNAGSGGDAYVQGTKVYIQTQTMNAVGCFDFAGYSGTGPVPACAGFTPFPNPSNYTARPMTGDPSCMLADGDGQKIGSFDAVTGGVCSTTSATETVSPAQYYCGSGSAGFTGWNQLAVTGAPAGSYTQATVSLTDASGNPVPGFTNVALAPGQALNLSAISTAAPTDQLTAQVTLHEATAAVTGAQLTVSWTGDTPQMCFETVAPPVLCAQSGTVSNAANAVTDATAAGGGTDAPAGNGTGTAQFTSTPTVAQCSLQFTKTAAPNPAQPGDTVTYTVTVKNTGTQPYTDPDPAAFTDDLTSVLSDATYNNDAAASTGSVSYAAPVLSWTGPATLNPGDTATITYSVTVGNPDTGPKDMKNTVVSSLPGSNCPAGTADPACSASVPVNSITLVKSPSPVTVAKAGDVITYSFLVTNTGFQALSGITVTDTLTPPSDPANLSPVTCPDTTLAPGASTTCTGTYKVTQADADHGTADDTATASGTPPTPPGGPTPPPVTSPRSPASVPVPPAPAVIIAKATTTASVTRAGQQVPYSFLVTNTGNVTLDHVTVTDTVTPPSDPANLSAVTCPATTLAPGASTKCTATYTVTQADVDNGSVDDSATVTGTPPATPGNPPPSPLPPSPRSDVSVPVAQAPAITVVKSAPSAEVAAAGDVIGYDFDVTNTGNVTLANITVSDTMTAPAGPAGLSPVTCPAAPLAPGASTTCTATYTLAQADVDNGSVADTATATGTPPSGSAVTSPPSALSVPVPSGPDINLVKSATPAQAHAPGDVIPYRFTVTNTGNDTLTNVTVTDVVAPPSDPANLSPVTCPAAPLAPGASVTCTATYTVTQADVDHGSADDTATAMATPPGLPPVTSPPVPLSVPLPAAPALRVVKSTTTTRVTAAGQKIPYSFLVTNTGNVTLTGITVTDTLAAPSDPANLSPVTCPAAPLAPGASVTCTATYTDTQADVDHGKVNDSATVTGTPPATVADPNPSPLPPSPPSAVSVPAVQHPGIAVVKTAAKDPLGPVGELIHYSFLVTNTGNVTLAKVGVSDVVAPPANPANLTAVTCPHPTLAPGASQTCTATYTVTAADVARGAVGNTATAYGTPPSGRVIRSRPHTISFSGIGGQVLIPTGEGASAPAPGTSPGLAAAGAAALAAGMVLLLGRRRRVTPGPQETR